MREETHQLVDSVYRADSGRVLATLIRLLGDFDLAEEALHEAFAAALQRWPRDGPPNNPFTWLVSAVGSGPSTRSVGGPASTRRWPRSTPPQQRERSHRQQRRE